MILAELLNQLQITTLELLAGDPGLLEMWRVAEFQGEKLSPTASGTFFLLGRPELVEEAASIISRERGCAFLMPASLVSQLSPSWQLAAKSTLLQLPDAIPLDLSASIQRALDGAESGSLSVDATSRARQDLVEDILLNRYQDIVALHARARALGIPVDRANTVIIVGFENFERFYLQNERKGELFFQRLKGQILRLVRQDALRWVPGAVVTPHAEGAVVLSEGAPDALGEHIAHSLRQELRFVPVAVAAGGIKSVTSELHKSYQEARLALQLRKRLRLPSRYVAFSQVTGYALLQQLHGAPDISSLLLDELQPLLDTEYSRHAVLIETMSAYLDSGSSLKKAAAFLEVHPKTLRYRLDRIEEILGVDALAGEKRLLYYLAAKYYIWINS